MLKQRVITAVVLLAFLLPALFAHSPWPFALLTLLFIGAAGWEWGRLNGLAGPLSVAVGSCVALLCGLALAGGWLDAPPVWAWQLGALAWLAGGAIALRSGPAGWPLLPRGLRLALGVLLLVLAWLALARAKVFGINFLLSVFCLVWVADIAAYFGGRAFGRKKLAPSISPGKSWAGVYAGMGGVMLLALGWLAVERSTPVDSGSIFRMLLLRFGAAGMVVGLVVLAAMSVVGDLFESLVKRAAGQKDSSALLPGHGGVLDRIDALLPVFPIALALVTLEFP